MFYFIAPHAGISRAFGLVTYCVLSCSRVLYCVRLYLPCYSSVFSLDFVLSEEIIRSQRGGSRVDESRAWTPADLEASVEGTST